MLRVQLRDLAGHPLRTAVVVALVAVCSSLVVAVAGLVQSVASTAQGLGDQAAGTADVEVASAFGGGTVPERVATAVEQVDGVGAVAPTVETAVTVGEERAVLLAGDQRALDFLPAGLSEALVAELGAQAASGRPLVSAELAAALGVDAGDTIPVRAPSGLDRAVVGGVLPADAAAGNLVVADLATGLRLRGGAAGYDRLLVDLGPGPGAAHDRTRRAIERVLDGRAALVDPHTRAEAATQAMQPVVQPLLLLAAITTVVAGVLVFNVVSVSVAERRRHLAVQCALGARRRHLWLRLIGEATVLGAIGGVLGAVLGRWVTGSLVDQVPSVLVNAALPTRIAVDVPAWLLAAGVAVGVIAAGAAAAVAGRPVMRLSPVEAMGPRDVVGEASPPVRARDAVLGAGCLVAGAATVGIAPPSALVVGALVMLIGVVALVWALRGPLARAVARVARWLGAPGLLAALAVERSPARNATTLLGALLPVTAVVSLGGLQVNVYDTAERSWASLADADVYVSAQPLSDVADRRLPPGLDRELADIDGVAQAVRTQFAFVRVGGSDALIEGVEPGTTAPLLHLTTPAARRQVYASDSAVVTHGFAGRLGLETGDHFTLPTAAGPVSVRVADVVESTTWPGGALAVSYDRLATWSDVDVPSLLEVHVDGPGADRAGQDVAAAVERYNRRTGDELFVTSGDQAVDDGLLAIRQSQALFAALQVVLMLAGAFAIVSTLVISTIGRTRELGLLRAVGARRRLVRRAVVVEAFVVTLAGAAGGVVVGTVFQFVGVRLAGRAAGFAADFAVTPRPSLTALVGGVAIAAMAAIAALRRVLRLDVLDAIAYE